MQLEQTLAKELAVIVNERIDERIAKCLDEVKRIIAELPRPERGERGEKGERGDSGLKGERGEQGERGEIGLAGINGKDGERGEKGERGDIGPRGETGLIGRDGLPGVPGRDGKDGRDGVNGKDGAPGPAGKDGIDGLGFDDMELILSEDGCSVIERYARGNIVKQLERRFRGRHRGPWRHDAEYYFDDTVVCNNCSWVAMVDRPKSKPSDGNAVEWQATHRKPRDGKDGERGPPGLQGPPGKDAAY